MYKILSILFILLSFRFIDANNDVIKIKYTQIMYKPKLALHIFMPSSYMQKDESLPVLVLFHGGGWRKGSAKQFFRQCRFFAANGKICISVDYRIKKGKDGPIMAVEDAKSAIRYIKQYADNLHIDKNKIIVGGGSVGGLLAINTAFASSINAPDDNLSIITEPYALMLFNPILYTGPKGFAHRRVKTYWREISPLDNLSNSMPTTAIFLGTRDKHVSVSMASEYCNKLKQLNTECYLHLYKNEKHGFFNYRRYNDVLRDANYYLNLILK